MILCRHVDVKQRQSIAIRRYQCRYRRDNIISLLDKIDLKIPLVDLQRRTVRGIDNFIFVVIGQLKVAPGERAPEKRYRQSLPLDQIIKIKQVWFAGNLVFSLEIPDCILIVYRVAVNICAYLYFAAALIQTVHEPATHIIRYKSRAWIDVVKSQIPWHNLPLCQPRTGIDIPSGVLCRIESEPPRHKIIDIGSLIGLGDIAR